MEEKNLPAITEEMAARYYDLSKKSKLIEKEMNDLKKQFHAYFDYSAGSEQKGEIELGSYKLTRQIRKTENYISETTIERLESLNLSDCIEVIRKPNTEKIRSAITLGFLAESDLEDCIVQKISSAITIKET
ncbi:hypothetical protein V1498_10255 [Peribacillus sp. SCS-26]|uniref:hypothetical protein n=1 Tax=Paraperibacillus marinus TaxID=3115295 RepID=UPI003906A7E5